MRFILNLTLMMVLVTMFALPLTITHMVVNGGRNDGTVAGVRSISEKEINIIPNLNDFNGYVEFSPQPLTQGRLEDMLSLTVFENQKATYRGLYTIYNLSTTQPVQIELISSGVDLAENLQGAQMDRLYISIFKSVPPQNLLQSVETGATLVELKNNFEYKEHEKIVIGQEIAEVVAISRDGVVVTPLNGVHLAGEMVWPESVVIQSSFDLVNPRSRTIILQPGEKATVDALVEGRPNQQQQDLKVKIPLTFRAYPVNSELIR